MNFPLNLRLAKGSGMSSPAWLISQPPLQQLSEFLGAQFPGWWPANSGWETRYKPNVFLILIRPCDTIGVVIIL